MVFGSRIQGRSLIGVQRRYADAYPSGVSMVVGVGSRKTCSASNRRTVGLHDYGRAESVSMKWSGFPKGLEGSVVDGCRESEVSCSGLNDESVCHGVFRGSTKAPLNGGCRGPNALTSD